MTELAFGQPLELLPETAGAITDHLRDLLNGQTVTIAVNGRVQSEPYRFFSLRPDPDGYFIEFIVDDRVKLVNLPVFDKNEHTIRVGTYRRRRIRKRPSVVFYATHVVIDTPKLVGLGRTITRILLDPVNGQAVWLS